MNAKDYIEVLNSLGITNREIAIGLRTTDAVVSRIKRGRVKDPYLGTTQTLRLMAYKSAQRRVEFLVNQKRQYMESFDRDIAKLSALVEKLSDNSQDF